MYKDGHKCRIFNVIKVQNATATAFTVTDGQQQLAEIREAVC